MPGSPRLGKRLNGSIVPEQGQEGNPPVPEEAVEIILISLCHFGTKGNGMDKKRKGASSTERVEVKVCGVGGLPRELCQAPGFISSDSPLAGL